MTTNKTLSIRRPEDILGYIPHMLGYCPEDSLVAITMQGKILGATLRVDLPIRHSPQVLAGFAERVRSYLISDEEADGVVVALYSDAGWADGAVVRTMVPLLEELRQCLDEVDLTVRDVWLVGKQYWRSAYCTDLGCCPVPGHSVDRIRDSSLSAELVYQGSTVGPPPGAGPGTSSLARHGSLDVEILEAEARYGDRLLSLWRNEQCLDAVLAVWQHVISTQGGGDPLQPAQDARLIGFLRMTLKVPAWRDAVIVMAAAGIESAKSGAAAYGLFDGDGGLDGNGGFYGDGGEGPVFDPCEVGVPAVAATPAAVPSTGSWSAVDVYTYGDVLLGMRPEVPLWPQLHALQQVLATLCVDGESGAVAAAALTIQGWISWCKGSGSIAHASLELAEAACPGYRLAELLSEVLAHGAICEWARRPGSAWRGQHGLSA